MNRMHWLDRNGCEWRLQETTVTTRDFFFEPDILTRLLCAFSEEYPESLWPWRSSWDHARHVTFAARRWTQGWRKNLQFLWFPHLWFPLFIQFQCILWLEVCFKHIVTWLFGHHLSPLNTPIPTRSPIVFWWSLLQFMLHTLELASSPSTEISKPWLKWYSWDMDVELFKALSTKSGFHLNDWKMPLMSFDPEKNQKAMLKHAKLLATAKVFF